jgi:hypothetical protein
MLEPDVTLTDYVLSLICVVFAWWCWRRRADAFRWYVVFFITLSLASLFGGTVHGFVPTGPWSEWLWCGVLFSLGGTAIAMWGITTALGCSPAIARRVMSVVAVLAVVYVTVVVSGVREFWITIVAYLPAAVGMLVAYVRHRHHPGPWRWGIIGVVLTFVAAGVQVGHVALHPVWFNHNALYHLIQSIALFGIARAAGGRITGEPHAVGQ